MSLQDRIHYANRRPERMRAAGFEAPTQAEIEAQAEAKARLKAKRKEAREAKGKAASAAGDKISDEQLDEEWLSHQVSRWWELSDEEKRDVARQDPDLVRAAGYELPGGL